MRGKDMLATHPIHLSTDKIIRSLTEFETFLTDLSSMNVEELQHTSTPEPLRVRSIQPCSILRIGLSLKNNILISNRAYL